MAGCGNFKWAIQKIKELIEAGVAEINSLAVVTDRDFNTTLNLEEEISSYVNYGVRLNNNMWRDCNYKDSFGEPKCLKVLLTIIPKDKGGALETIMLEAVKMRGSEEEKLGNEVEKFIEKLKSERLSYLSKERFVIKSKLGCTLNIMDPERTFKDIIPTFYNIPWGKYKIIEDHLENLKNYK